LYQGGLEMAETQQKKKKRKKQPTIIGRHKKKLQFKTP
jgi:hypothetical protein